MSKKKVEEITGFCFTLQGEEWKCELREGPIFIEGVGRVSGFTDADARLIVIETSKDKTWLRKVFGHEWLHAVVSPVSTTALRGKEGWLVEEQCAELVGRAYNELMEQAILLPGWVTNRVKVK